MVNNVKSVTEKNNGKAVSTVTYTHDFMGNVTEEVAEAYGENKNKRLKELNLQPFFSKNLKRIGVK